jgi:hypothetical protein
VVLSGCGLRTRRERYLVVLTSATAQTRGQVSAACQPEVPAQIRGGDVTDITEARLPPRSGPGDRTLTVQAVGAMVPSWAVFGQR